MTACAATVTVIAVLVNPPYAAVMFAVPYITAVTTPPLFTVATPGADEPHYAEAVTSTDVPLL